MKTRVFRPTRFLRLVVFSCYCHRLGGYIDNSATVLWLIWISFRIEIGPDPETEEFDDEE